MQKKIYIGLCALLLAIGNAYGSGRNEEDWENKLDHTSSNNEPSDEAMPDSDSQENLPPSPIPNTHSRIPNTHIVHEDIDLYELRNRSPAHKAIANSHSHALFLTALLFEVLRGTAENIQHLHSENSSFNFQAHITTILSLANLIATRWGITENMKKRLLEWSNTTTQNSIAYIHLLTNHIHSYFQELNPYPNTGEKITAQIQDLLIFSSSEITKNLPQTVSEALINNPNGTSNKAILKQASLYCHYLATHTQDIFNLPLNYASFSGDGGDQAIQICIDQFTGNPEDFPAVEKYLKCLQERLSMIQNSCKNTPYCSERSSNDNDDEDQNDNFNWLTNLVGFESNTTRR